MRALLIFVFICLTIPFSYAQYTLQGYITSNSQAVPYAHVQLRGTSYGAVCNENGAFRIDQIPEGNYEIIVSAIGYHSTSLIKNIKADISLNFSLQETSTKLQDVVISGTMTETSKSESPVPIETYHASFFKMNPNPSLLEGMQNINGVRPQINCNVCNTGDIHINGLEGPYTMILIDGMPIVSGLSSVYGLNGIPQSLIERVEIVKGPASTLYGSEAIGGLINVITKKTNDKPFISADIFASGWAEFNVDLSSQFHIHKKAQSLIGINYFNYQNPIDHNHDNFTDVTLQNRISLFNKWNFVRKKMRAFSLAARYIFEDRWGGEVNWTPEYRGGREIYGESIHTERWELLGNYQLPLEEDIRLMLSLNTHDQNAAYGDTWYIADQKIGFGQLIWNKQVKRHHLLSGAAFRYTYYDDNTPATANLQGDNQPSHSYLPGIFVQDEFQIKATHTLLLGMRYDYHSLHQHIFTPRLNYKWNSENKMNTIRVSIGNGYRVANVFTEDHAALTGAREVIFLLDLQPESSWNTNINFVKNIYTNSGFLIDLDFTAYYTYFNNKIFADYETDPNKIIYDNLNGYAVSKGVSLNVDLRYGNVKAILGCTLMDVYSIENKIRNRQLLTEQFTGVWNIGYTFPKLELTIDYTGNVYGPMVLPLLSSSDPRPLLSPWWSLQNIQLSKKHKNWEFYGGIKNLLNWVPWKGIPFLIARAHDPFDKEVEFDANGKVISTPDNPYGLTFDPAYTYAPNQGLRFFLGLRLILQ